MISSVRRITQSLLLSLFAASAALAGEISSADLQIQGVGLKVITVSVTTGLDIPAAIQTEFGGKQNDDAPVVEGLLAVGELSGPGIETPIRLETAPGHKFQIPGLSREGVYFLQNIRLTKDGEFLQTATPSVATITVSNLLQTSVRVRQLTPEELRARGITIDGRNYDVYEYTFSFIINGQVVEIPFPVIIDNRTHEVRPLPDENPYNLPPPTQVLPPRWEPPEIFTFEMGPAPETPSDSPPPPSSGGGGGRPSIPAAIVIPNSMAVLHQFFAVTLMVSNGAPDGSSVTLDSVTATIKPPGPLRTVKSIPAVAFGQPVPIVDATTGVTFLVAQARGEAEWTMEGLQPGTHTVEVDVRATYKAPGQNDFPMKGTARATVVVHDPRFHINFSHPDTVREGIDYTTYSFITNMSPVEQHIRVSSGLPACLDSPGANVCRVDGTPEFEDLSIPAGEMRSLEYKLRPGVTGSVFATAGTVSDEAISASVQLHMGVSESGIPLSPATLLMPYYSRFVSEPMVGANLQLLGLGYSLATAPLVPALAKHPNVIKSDVFQRAVDIARAGQRVFLGEPMRDALAHMSLDLLGNANELREWDELRRNEKSGRKAAAAIARELEANSASQTEFIDRFAAATAWRAPYLLAATSAGNLSLRNVATNAQAAVPSEAESGWIRTLPFAELTNFRTGKLATAGRWSDDFELTITPSADGPIAFDAIFPAATDGSVIRAHADITGTNGQPLTVRITRGASTLEVRDAQGGIAAVGTLTAVAPEAVRILGARQDLHLDPNGHKVSVLWNRPVSVAPGDDLLAKFTGQIVLNRDGVSYTGNRPISSAALQDGARIVNVTFDHALSQNATYTMNVAPLVDPMSGGTVSFNSAIVPVIDNDAPGGIIFGHVLKGDNSPVADAEVRLYTENAAPQYDLSRASDGAFLFEFVARDIDNGIDGGYELEAVATDGKSTKVNGAVRLPGRVHFVNLVFLGRGSAEGYVRYDNGEAVPNARVVVGSTLFDQFRTTDSDANGHYSIGDLPVGPLTFSATDEDGNVTFAATEIKTPGQVLQKDLSIYRRPFPGVATIRGVVKRSDTNAVVAGARVGVYSQGYGLIDGVTDSSGRFEFRKVPSGFVTVLAAEWNVSREATALDFDLAADETRDLTLTLNVKPEVALVAVEGDVVRENPLFPGDASKYEKVAGAIVKIENAQAVTADTNGHYVFPSIPVSFAGKKISAYDPITTRSATTTVPTLNPAVTNIVPLFISTADGYGTGSVRVRLLSAAGIPVAGYRVIVPGFPPDGPTPLEEKAGGVYELKDVPVGGTADIWAIGSGDGMYGDQTVNGRAKVEFNGHVAALNLRLPGQGLVRVKLAADIDLIGDVSLVYPAWDEAEQTMKSKTRSASTSENGIAGFATFSGVPALQNFTASSAHPVYGYASQSTKLGFDGDVATIILQLNKLATVSGVIYAVDGRTPIPGAAVRIEDGRQNPGIFTSRPDGTFEFKNVAAAVGFRVIAEITQDGVYRTGIASGTTPALGGPVANVAVIMRTQGAVEGRIVYAGYKVYDPQNSANNVLDNTPSDLTDNAPVPLANFALKELDFPQRNFGIAGDWITADIAGRFQINNVFTGPLRITASDPGNQEIRGTWTGTLSLEGEQITAYVGIGATGFGPVTVRVVDPNAQNAAVVNAEVALIRGYDLFDFATTDGNGIVQFAEVPVGTYRVTGYSKALGKSGASANFSVAAITGASVEVVLEFSGRVDGKLSDPEAGGRGVPGAPVTLTMPSFQTRASTDVAGVFLFEGVREGTFKLEAKDTLSNRRATATRSLTQADPNPYVSLELEPTETLHVAVYLPNDTGGNSNVLASVVNIEVRQRNNDFYRALQGNSFQMQGLLENERYSIKVDEVGGEQRTLSFSGSFPQGSASNPLKLVFQARGSVEVHVVQSGQPAANAKVTVSGGGKSATVYTDAAGFAIAPGIPLGSAFVQVVSVDGAFSGSASTSITSQSTAASVTITLGAYAGLTGFVEAELGGASVGTRVIASFGRILEMLTDSTGHYTFQGIPTNTRVDLTYMGPNDVTVGARQSVNIALSDASKVVVAPNVKLDATPPQVTSIFPADGASNVSPDSSVRLVFSERIASNYINTSYLQLIPADSPTPVSTSYVSSPNADGTFTVTMTPPAAPVGQRFPLKSNTLYRIIVSGEVRDLTGNKLPTPRGASFITSDYAEPQVVKVVPAVTQALQPATTFEFRFNEPIDPAPFDNGGDGVFHLYKISTAGVAGTIIREVPGDAFVDPANGLTLFFAPSEAIEQESFYRVFFSGARDLQGNAAAPQTFHFFSYDLVRPWVNFVSPVPDGYPLISGVEYFLGVDIRNGNATGSTATDVSKVDYFRVQSGTAVYIATATSAPWSYRFVAPDVPAEGGTYTLAATATDLSFNEGEQSNITWQVMPNAAPKNVAIALTPAGTFYAGNHAFASVTFEDEGTFASMQIEARGTKRDGSIYTSSQTKQLTRVKVNDPWPAANFDFDVPATLAGNTKLTFTATITDVRGLKGTGTADLDLALDAVAPDVLSLTPAAQTQYEIGDKYQITTVVKDLQTGLAEVVFAFDNQTIRLTQPNAKIVKTANGTWVVTSGDITVPAKNVDTTIAITVTAKDYEGNSVSRSTEVVYIGVNDPSIPKGAWACPTDRAAYPASATFPIKLSARASDDIAITGVTFTVPGVATPIGATRVGTTDLYEATTTVTTPAAGTPFALTVTISDADPTHDLALTIPLELVDIDITVENRTQAVTAADVATYTNKSILVKGATGKFIPHVALTLKNLVVLDGGRVETLSTTTTLEQRLDLTITGALSIDCASSIDVSARGYLGGWGVNADGSGTKNDDMRGRTVGNTPVGGPSTYAAASHGGVGGETNTGVTNAVYGSITNPTALGTGGGGGVSTNNAGGSGGGAIRIQSSIVSVSGAIRANGASRSGDGNPGSGGSIFITAAHFITSPLARITANGGDDDATSNASRGAGGGRIAVIAGDRLDVETTGLQLQSRGGRNDTSANTANYLDGGSGTIYLGRPGQTLGELFVSAIDERVASNLHLTRPTPLSGTLQFDRLTLGPRALVRADAALEVNGTTDDRTAVTIDPTAALVLQSDVPVIQTTTTPVAGGTVVQGGTLGVTYTATSFAGVGAVTLAWSPVAPNRTDAYFTYPASATPASTIQLAVPTDAVAGPASLTLSASDRAGRSAQVAPITFAVVVNAPPVVDAFDPLPLAIYPGQKVTTTVSAHDDLKVTKITFTSTIGTGTPAAQTFTPPTQPVVGKTFDVTVPIATPGGQPLTLDLSVEDAFPNRAATTQQTIVSILKDLVAPSVTITSPAPNALFNEGTGNTISVRATIDDAEVGVKDVFVQIGDGVPVALTKSGSQYIATVPVPPVDGADVVTLALKVIAKDYEGNTASPSIDIRIQPVNDPNAPAISWVCSTTGMVYPASYNAKLRVYAIGNTVGNATNGIQKVELFVDDATTPITATAVAGLANHYDGTFAIPADAAADRIYNVRAVATNAAGLSESIGTYFTIVAGRVITADTTITNTDTSYDNQTVIVRGGTTTIIGAHPFERLVVLDGAKVTHPATDLTTVNRLTFSATLGVFVSCTGSIDATSRGITGSANSVAYTYDRATGKPTLTGGATNYSAGSHGGEGSIWTGNVPAAYGSIFDPNEPGGAGAGPTGTTCNPCRSGGGVIRFSGPTVHVDGTILANGQIADGSGAGGSIRIDADTVRGGGEIHADGGTNTSGASGGGGRIAIYSKSIAIPTTKITAAALAASGTFVGAAGTLYFQRLDTSGAKLSDEIVVDNLARTTAKGTALVTVGSGTVVGVSGNEVTLSSAVPFDVERTWVHFLDPNGGIAASHEITARTATTVTLAGNVTVAAGSAYRGAMRADRITSRGSALIDATAIAAPSLAGGTSGVIRTPFVQSTGDVAIENNVIVEVSGRVDVPNLTLRNTATLTHPRATATTINRLTVDVADTLTIDATSSIDVSTRGITGGSAGTAYTYDGLTGKPTLTGGSYNYTAGSHGGQGGLWSGNIATPYGSVFNPTTPGGAGAGPTNSNCLPCRSGGGVVHVTATRVVVDGKILANGEATDGAGAGGSIRIDVDSLEGAGEIHADGGINASGASGGGGRIAVYYATKTLPDSKITALSPQAQNANAVGAPGTIFLESDAQADGSLIVDNGTRTTLRNTRLAPIGYATVTEAGTDFLRDANAQFPSQNQLEGVQAIVRYDLTRALPIVTNDDKTLRVSGSASFANAGDALRGRYVFDSLKLRNARLDTIDLVTSSTAVDKDAASVILGNNQAPPAVDMGRLALQTTATGAAVVGTAGAVFDLDTPITLNAKNMRTGNVYVVTAAADGSFATPVQGDAGDAITIWARDANAYPLQSPVLSVGNLAQGTPVPSQISRTEWTTDTNFYARTLSRDGGHLAVASYPTTNGANDKLVVLSVVDPAHPNLLRVTTSGVGAIRDVVVYGGWAYVAADRLYTLDLTNPTATPNYPGDVCGSDMAVAVAGGYAFTTEGNCYNDGRIIIYDVSSPATPRLIRHESVGGVGGLSFSDLFVLGSDYLVGVSGNRPGSLGYDVVVIDRRDLNDLKKVATLDVPSFDAFRGTLVDTTLYLVTRTSSQIVVVDLADPAAPVVIGTGAIPAGAGGAAVIGRDAFAAAGTAGLATLDVTNPAAPLLTGTTTVGGTAFDVTVIGAYAYVANEQGVSLVPAQVAPQVVVPRIAMNLAGTIVTVTGLPQSVMGNAPIQVSLTNLATNATISGIVVAGDGSFSGTLPASPGDRVTITATDSFGRITGPLSLGMVPFGTAASTLVISPSMSDSAFFTRNVATAGNHLVAGSYPTDNGSSDKVVIFDIANRAAPVHRRTVASGVGAVRDIAVVGDWAYIAADRLFTLNLASATSTPNYPGDVCGSDWAMEVVSGFAFVAEGSCYNDGRIIIYDVSTPATPRLIRHESVAGFGGYRFTDLSALGTDYLVGVSGDAPGGIGRDVMIIDRRDINDLKKVAELDIPSFSAFRVKAVGTKLYVSGIGGGMAVVDASVPTAPVLVGIVKTPGYPRSVDAIGAMLAVADGSAGATFVDIAPAGLPTILGNQPIGGNAWECALSGDTLYIANEQGIAVIDDLGTPPLIDRARITTASDGAMLVTITGSAGAILGLPPVELEVRNATSGEAVTVPVDANGGFATTLAGVSGDALTVRATDSIGRVAGPLTIGIVPFGASIQHITITPAMSDSAFLARNVAAGGNYVIVSGYPTDIGSSDKILVFDATVPSAPVYVRTISSGVGAVRDLAIVDGYAIVAADRTFTVNLTVPNATPSYPGDVCGSDMAIEFAGGYVFAAEGNCYNDGRIISYDMSTPSAPRMIRHDSIAGFGGYRFTDLTSLGTNYLIGISPDRPSNIGRDVMVIDRRDINNLRKVSELDIPNFSGFRGRVLGNMLYVTGVDGGVAVVDLTNPAAPQHLSTDASTGAARSIDIAGNTLAVANGSNGVSFVDVTTPGTPRVIAAQPVPGSAWDVALNRGAMYVAAELGLTTVAPLGVPPMFDETLVTITPASTSTTVTGAADALTGIAPLIVRITNTATGALSAPTAVAADGSFVAVVAATPGQSLILSVTDVAGRVTTRSLGSTYGPTSTRFANPGVANGDTNYRARRVNAGGDFIVVSTGSVYGASVPVSDKMLIFPRPGAADQTVKVKASGVGGVHDVKVVNGVAYFVADRLAIFDLNDPAMTVRYPGDVCGSDVAMALSSVYAFTAESGCYNDGRIIVYNIANPAAPTMVRHQSVAGIGGFSFRAMASLGTSYVIGMSPDRPSNVGHDVVVIDVTNVNSLTKVADIDIPSFDALDGIIDGSTLYIAGGDGGVAIVDLTNPLAPSVRSVTNTPGIARGLTLGRTGELIVADAGGPGLTFLDVTNKSAPVITGTQSLEGNITDVDFAAGEIYVAGENYFHTIVRPQE